MKKNRSYLFYICFWAMAIVIAAVIMIENVGNARIINYSGIVRGATQKLVKEELNGNPDDDLIAQLDGILANLQTGKGDYDLRKCRSVEYQQKLSEMQIEWTKMKAEIARVREGSEKTTLFELSQNHFEMANEMVRRAEVHSNFTLWSLLGFFSLYLAVTVLAFSLFTRRKRLDMEKSLMTDNLTGLLNRNGFESAADKILHSREDAYALIKFDVDDFKFVNETYGFDYGDKILKLIADALRAHCSGSQVCARLGADEFIALVFQTENAIENLQEQILNRLNAETRFDAAEWMTITIGAYEVDRKQSVKAMMDDVGIAHKTSKNRGRANVLWYDEDLLECLRREKFLSNHMRQGLEREEFQLYLQPKFDIKDERLTGAEALVRWDNPETGLLYPDSFISLFEKNGTIPDLDFYMLKKVCRHIRTRLDGGFEVLPISVNFSRVTLYLKDFFDRFLRIVREYGIPPYYLELEITEGFFEGVSESILRGLKEIHELGFVVSMDDFGSGYSSLNLINSLPIQVLKLDRNFLKEFAASETVGNVIRCVVELAHALNVQVICEGVETEDQRLFLQSVSCDYGQGYLLSKPISEEKFSQLFYQK